MKHHHQQSSNLIFKNGFKNVFDSKLQLFGLTILFFLLGLIVSSVAVITRRISQSLVFSNQHSRLHDVVGSFDQARVSIFNSDLNVKVSRNGGAATFAATASAQAIANFSIVQEVMQQLADRYQFEFTYKETRNFLVGEELWLKVIGFDVSQSVDRLIITAGQGLARHGNGHGIVLENRFAALHHIKIGDVVRVIPDNYGTNLLVNSQLLSGWRRHDSFKKWLEASQYATLAWYEVRGFGISADFTYPIIARDQPVVDKQHQGIAYVKNENFGLQRRQVHQPWSYHKDQDLLVAYNQSATESFYAIHFTAKSPPSERQIENIINGWNNTLMRQGINRGDQRYLFSPLTSDKLFFARGDPTYDFARRVNFPLQMVQLYRTLSLMTLCFIGVITMIVIFLLIKQRVDNRKGQVGLLKAYGYHKSDIFISFLMFPISVGLVGGVSGFLFALLTENSFVRYFNNYLNFSLGGIFVPWVSLIVSLFLFFGVILFVTWAAVYRLLFKPCVDLIYRPNMVMIEEMPRSYLKSRLYRFFNRLPFWSRLKLRVVATSLAKSSGIVLTFCVGSVILGTATFFGRALLDAKTYYFANNNFRVASFYQPPVWNVPTSFYRVYDFTNTAWPDASSFPATRTIIDQLVHRHLSPQYYDLKLDLLQKFPDSPHYLYQLQWKNFDLLAFRQLIAQGFHINPVWAGLIIPRLWPDYQDLESLLEHNDLFCAWQPPSSKIWIRNLLDTKTLRLIFTAVRRFYLKYRTGVVLSVNPRLLKPSQPYIDPFSGDFKFDDFLTSKENPFLFDGQSKQVHPFSIHNHHLGTTEDQAIIAIHDPFTGAKSDWQQQIYYLQDMINWFNVTFFNRYLPAMVQGFYSRAPYYVRQYFHKVLNYNLAFNLVPTTSDDYLGTYINARVTREQTLRILGVSSRAVPKFINLGQPLASEFWQTTPTTVIPMVINQSLAHLYHLKLGQTTTNFQLEIPQVAGQFGDDGKTAKWPEKKQDLAGYDFSQVLTYDDQKPPRVLINGLQMHKMMYQTVHPYQVTDFELATPVVQALQQHQTFLTTKALNPRFKIVGIQNNYGSPTAYINQSQANRLCHYDWTRSVLYQLFRQIWHHTNIPLKVVTTKQLQAIKDIEQATTLNDLQNSYAQRMFAGAFPVFNYRLSQSPRLDLATGVSITNSFGDFSAYALDGNLPQYVGYGTNTLDTAFSVAAMQQIIRKQLTLLLLVTIFICAVFISMSMVIIGLASNLIIGQHHHLIQNLRIMGYNDGQILRVICGFFVLFLPVALGLGLMCGWYTAQWWIGGWVLNFKVLLPLILHFTSVMVGLGAVVILFLTAFGLSFWSLKQTSLVKTIRQSGTNV